MITSANKKILTIIIIVIIISFVIFLWWLGGRNIETKNNLSEPNNLNFSETEIEKAQEREKTLSSLLENKNKENLPSTSFPTKSFTEKDLKQTQTNSQDFYQEYAKKMTETISPLSDFDTPPAEIIINAIERNDFSQIVYLEKRLKVNIDMINNLLEITVPNEAIKHHLSLINSLVYLNQPLFNMSQIESDIAKALTGAERYQKEILKTFKIINKFNQFFNDKGITIDNNVDKQTESNWQETN
ncbi:MAG: hypothetical protein ACOCU8_02690 [Patescibacteria group bacterium]